MANSRLVQAALDEEKFADLSVEFQRLHSASDKSAKRSTYDSILKELTNGFSATVVLPVKSAAEKQPMSEPILTKAVAPLVVADKVPTAFVGHSFAESDKAISRAVVDVLGAIGVITVTGEKPKAERISDKVKELIESQEIFVGLFTRRDKIQGRPAWTTTSWVLEEKAYAVAKRKRLVLIREEGVESIGGIHGDHEYITFSRDETSLMLVKVLQTFSIRTGGLR